MYKALIPVLIYTIQTHQTLSCTNPEITQLLISQRLTLELKIIKDIKNLDQLDKNIAGLDEKTNLYYQNYITAASEFKEQPEFKKYLYVHGKSLQEISTSLSNQSLNELEDLYQRVNYQHTDNPIIHILKNKIDSLIHYKFYQTLLAASRNRKEEIKANWYPHWKMKLKSNTAA